MPTISNKKKDKISEQILSILYDNFPKLFFTSHIAKEIARDEEFTKSLLNELDSKDLITKIQKNPKGVDYTKRIRWKLSNKTYDIFNNNLRR